MWLKKYYLNVLLLLISLGASAESFSSKVVANASMMDRSIDTLKFDIESGKDTIGYCKTINLRTQFKPNLPGKFSINGRKSRDDKFNPTLDGQGVGEYKISYKAEGQYSSNHAPISLWVVGAPILTVSPKDTSLCPGQTAELTISPNGYGPFNLVSDIKIEKYNNAVRDSIRVKKDSIEGSFIFSARNSFPTRDSLYIFIAVSLTDRYACPALDLDTAVVEFLNTPQLRVLSQYTPTDANKWQVIYDPYFITNGDYVDYKIAYTKGKYPWYYQLNNELPVGPIYGQDTIVRATKPGGYRFRVRNTGFCISTMRVERGVIFFKE